MDIRIKSNDELESQVQTLKEYYGVKSKSGAIKKAVRDCSMVANIKNITGVLTNTDNLQTDNLQINNTGTVYIDRDNLPEGTTFNNTIKETFNN